jgi:hypothetical protein
MPRDVTPRDITTDRAAEQRSALSPRRGSASLGLPASTVRSRGAAIEFVGRYAAGHYGGPSCGAAFSTKPKASLRALGYRHPRFGAAERRLNFVGDYAAGHYDGPSCGAAFSTKPKARLSEPWVTGIHGFGAAERRLNFVGH